MQDTNYLQYEADFCAPVGWVHYDASPTLWCERLPLLRTLVTKNDQGVPSSVQLNYHQEHNPFY